MKPLLIVDSSVWLSLARNAALRLRREEFRQSHDLAVTGTIVQEVLQGCRGEPDFQQARRKLDQLTYLAELPADFTEAALIYARLRWIGITIPSNDCRIAAVAVRLDVDLFADDHHFSHIPRLRLLLPA